MTQGERKKLLVVCNAALGVALAAAVAGVFLPLQLPAETAHVGSTTRPATARKLDPINDYAVIYQRDFRKPLFETTPAEAAPEAPTAALQIRLKGTAVEHENSFAMFETATGELVMAGVGDVVDGAEVITIADDCVTAKYGGRTVKIPIEKTEATP